MADSDPSNPARALLRSALSPLSLAVLGGAGAVAGALHSLPVAAVGALAYGALVAWDALGGGASAPPEKEAWSLPPPSRYVDPGTRAAMESLAHAAAERRRALREAPESVRAALAGAFADIDELERNAVSLADRAEELAAYLHKQDRNRIAAEAARMAEAAARTRDTNAKAEFSAAEANKADQLQVLDDLVAARDRALGNLARIVTTLDALPGKVVRMKALDDAAQDALGTDVIADLGRLTGEIRLFEQTLKHLSDGSIT